MAKYKLQEMGNMRNDDKTSPIDSEGSGSHKVWVKRKE